MRKRRYERNHTAISQEENRILAGKKACVAGCGGLGGGVIEGLVRTGVGTVVAVDGDVFVETNLNRQVFSNEENMGKSKAEEAAVQSRLINSEVEVIAVNSFIDEKNVREIIADSDVAVDALDNAEARKMLEAACEEAGIPLVHGAVAGWNGQVSVIIPGQRMIEALYEGESVGGDENDTGNPYFTPAVISALEVAEAIKLLLGKESSLEGKLLTVDLMNHQYEIIDFGE